MTTPEAQGIGLQGIVHRLREIVAGLVMPTRGGCVCDPVAWERETSRRIEERDIARPPAPETR